MDEKKMSYYTKHLKADFKASIVVFLVAIPLCLGIALASGAPLFAGLISGIVGGLVVSWASGSQLSVAGPAAGLTVIVLGAIETLGSYPLFLVSVVLAGLLQIAMGYLKAGTLGAFFPSAVIKGMLAGIGLILIIKQIPHAFGYDVNFEGDDSYMLESSSASWNTLMESFSAQYVGAVGNQSEITPRFDQLAAEGVLFDHFFSNGTHTHQGIFATLAGFPNLPGFETLMQQPHGATGFSGLAELLRKHQNDYYKIDMTNQPCKYP